jgi:heptosyltransferase-2
MFPRAEISWVTYCPEILPVSYVDNILEVNLENTTWLMANSFDWLINLDKDRFAIALAKLIAAKRKSGFGIDKFGKCTPFTNKRAKDKWLTGIDDELSKQNTKNYLEEIFGICGFDFQNEEYIIEAEPKSPYSWPIDYSRRVIGLNNGSGPLWRARLWPEQHWIELAKQLKNDGYEVLLLGGEQEYDKNTEIAHLSGVKYFGHFNIKKFIDLVNHTTLLKITNRGIYP